MLRDPAIPAAAKNTRLIPAAREKITHAEKALATAKPPATPSPPSCPPAPSTRTRKSRCRAPAAAACRWSCGCLPATPGTGWHRT